MTSNSLPSSVRTVLACLLLAVGLTFGAAAVGSVSSAGAQATTDVDPNDFIDPATGQFDIEAYLAALAAANANAGNGASGATGATTATGTLPTTGSSTVDFAGLGIAFIVVGGAGVWAARRSQPEAATAVDAPAAD